MSEHMSSEKEESFMRFSIPAKGGPLAHPLECDSCQSSGATADHEHTITRRNEVGLAA